jgi:hypothetical protein
MLVKSLRRAKQYVQVLYESFHVSSKRCSNKDFRILNEYKPTNMGSYDQIWACNRT